MNLDLGRVLNLGSLAVLSAVFSFGCGRNIKDATTKDVGTDLNSNGSSYLYWIEGANVLQGRCSTYQPVIKENCGLDKKFMPYQDFADRLLAPVQTQLASATQKVGTWQQEFYRIDNAWRADPYNASLQGEWRYVKGQLDTANYELACIQGARNDATSALLLLTNYGVTHRVMWGNGLYNNTRPFVAKFYEIFNGAVPPLPPPPPAPPKVTWVDSSTGKTWGFIADQMTWTDANRECQRRPGWRLPLSAQDFAAGDGSNLDMVNRLYASPIGAAMVQLPYQPVSGGSQFQAKVIWTGDNTPSNDYGALLYTYADISGHGLSRYLHLLSSNSRYSVVCVKD